MVIGRPNATLKLLAAFLVSFLLCVTLLSGCGQRDKTTVGWKPASPIGIYLTREEKGLWRFNTNIPLPIKGLGVFSIDHELDVRDEYTYIIIKDRKKGTEQVFELGINKGKVKLHTVGEHNVTIQPESGNRIIIDDEVRSGKMTIEIYPEGQKLAGVFFDNGTEFVFLSDKRLHIEYGSIANSIKREALPDFLSLLRSDDSISLNSIDKVIFKRDLGLSQLRLGWKQEIKANQEPLVIELPKKGKSMISKIDDLKNAFKNFVPNIQFATEYPNTNLWWFLAIECIGIPLIIYTGSLGGDCLVVLLWLSGTLLFIIYTLITLISDLGYIGF